MRFKTFWLGFFAPALFWATVVVEGGCKVNCASFRATFEANSFSSGHHELLS